MFSAGFSSLMLRAPRYAHAYDAARCYGVVAFR